MSADEIVCMVLLDKVSVASVASVFGYGVRSPGDRLSALVTAGRRETVVAPRPEFRLPTYEAYGYGRSCLPPDGR